MSAKLNCWEFKNCGREKGGLMAEILGECPVPQAMEFDGLNGGVGAGRACWMVPGSNCHRRTGQRFRSGRCLECAFYLRVMFEEENASFSFTERPSTSAVDSRRPLSADLLSVKP